MENSCIFVVSLLSPGGTDGEAQLKDDFIVVRCPFPDDPQQQVQLLFCTYINCLFFDQMNCQKRTPEPPRAREVLRMLQNNKTKVCV